MLFCEAQPYQNADDLSVHPVFRGRQHVHLMATEERELRFYAEHMNIPLRWLQRDVYGVAHFDLTGKFMRAVMLDDNVVKMERVAFVTEVRKLWRESIATRKKAK